MIRLNFVIENPYSDKFDAGYSWAGKITKNKAWEIQAYRSNTVVEATLEVKHRTDHAGIKIEFGLFSYSFVAQFYDTRHWNYEKRCWEQYSD